MAGVYQRLMCGLQWPLHRVGEACPELCGSRKFPAGLGLADFAGALAGSEEAFLTKSPSEIAGFLNS